MNSKLIIFITSTEIYGYDITNLSDVSVISIDGDSRMKLDDGPVSDFIEYIKDWYSIESFSEIDIEAAVIDCNSERTVLHELLSRLKDCISVSVYPLKAAVLYALIGKNSSAADGECVDYAGYTYKISCAGGEYSVEEAEPSDSSIKLSDSDFYFVFHMKAVSGGADQAEVEELNAKCEELNVLVENIKKENTELNMKIKDITNENSNLRNELEKIKQQQKLAEELKKIKEQKERCKPMIIFSKIPDNLTSVQGRLMRGDINLENKNNTYTGMFIKKDTIIACYVLEIRDISSQDRKYFKSTAQSSGLIVNSHNDTLKQQMPPKSTSTGSVFGIVNSIYDMTYSRMENLPDEFSCTCKNNEGNISAPIDGKFFWLVTENHHIKNNQPIAVIGNENDTIDTINNWLKETGHTERVF